MLRSTVALLAKVHNSAYAPLPVTCVLPTAAGHRLREQTKKCTTQLCTFINTSYRKTRYVKTLMFNNFLTITLIAKMFTPLDSGIFSQFFGISNSKWPKMAVMHLYHSTDDLCITNFHFKLNCSLNINLAHIINYIICLLNMTARLKTVSMRATGDWNKLH